MIQNKIVVRYQDGRINKGVTNDFSPNKDLFHLFPWMLWQKPNLLTVSMQELKAVFFVKTFEGNPGYNKKKSLKPIKTVIGRKIRVIFKMGKF